MFIYLIWKIFTQNREEIEISKSEQWSWFERWHFEEFGGWSPTSYYYNSWQVSSTLEQREM